MSQRLEFVYCICWQTHSKLSERLLIIFSTSVTLKHFLCCAVCSRTAAAKLTLISCKGRELLKPCTFIQLHFNIYVHVKECSTVNYYFDQTSSLTKCFCLQKREQSHLQINTFVFIIVSAQTYKTCVVGGILLDTTIISQTSVLVVRRSKICLFCTFNFSKEKAQKTLTHRLKKKKKIELSS